MRIHALFITTHVFALLLGAVACFLVGLLGGGATLHAVMLSIAAGLSAATGYWLANRVAIGVASIEKAAANSDGQSVTSVGIHEVDSVVTRMRELIQRWTDAAASSREQARDIEFLLGHLGRRERGAGRMRVTNAGAQLRQLLGSVTTVADAELTQILSCTKEIEKYTREISSGAEDQSEAVSKTTTYVEQMSSNIDSVASNAGAAQSAATSTRDAAAEALILVRELITGMDRIRAHVEASESRLRSLGDHSQEIGSIVETISAISSRTDMLALNASIESVRAGEHGRGFAIVAEEVRKLAEQAAQATREVATLIESIQHETQESIAVMAEERAEVEAETRRVNAAGQALEKIGKIAQDSAAQVSEITQATQLQLHLTRDVVLCVERISEVAKVSRTRAEEACWTTGTLSKLAKQFDESLSPLRRCVRRGGDYDRDDDRRPVRRESIGSGRDHADVDANELAEVTAAH